MYWAHYSNDIWKRSRPVGERIKDQDSLYSFIRSLRSPANRIGNFYTSHIMGGPLDQDAGDGTTRASALPIAIPAEAEQRVADDLRAAIATVWRDSNWQEAKDTFARFGAVLGDVGLMVVDDPVRQKCYFRVVHPRTIVSLTRDAVGNVTAYELHDWRPDPEDSPPPGRAPRSCQYGERATRVGEGVLYQTFRDGEPYDWREYDEGSEQFVPEWTESYGFIPFVFVQHKNIGSDWGEAEFAATLSRFNEIDDQASKVCDQVAKVVEAFWLYKGMNAPGALPAPGSEGGDVAVDYGQGPGRLAVPGIWSTSPDAGAQALVAPLDFAGAQANIQALADDIAQAHPELQADDVGASSSGEARRVAREKVEAIVVNRRGNYNGPLVRAHQMAISIGAQKGYPCGAGFTPESFDKGELDHAIGDRPVFAVDESDRVAVAGARFTAMQAATAAGVPLASAAKLVGFSAEQVEEILKDRDAEAASAKAAEIRASQIAYADEPADPAPDAPGDPGAAQGAA